jgi:small basic protein (TIGR04137 family)
VRQTRRVFSNFFRSIAAADREKLQAPSFKLQRSIKLQTTKVSHVGAWDLELLWSLDLGVWSFSDEGLKKEPTVVTSRLSIPEENWTIFMSQHRSLKGASTITAKRNVLKRFERVELLKKRGQFKDGQKVLGLPKTKPDV